MYGNYCDAVKTKIVISAALALFAVLGLAQAGPQAWHFCAERVLDGVLRPSAVCPRYSSLPEVRLLRLADLLLPWYYGYVSSPVDVFDQLQQCLASFSTTAKWEFTAFPPRLFPLRR